MRLDHDRPLWILGVQTFDIRAHRTWIDQPAIDEDLIVRRDRYKNVLLFRLRLRDGGIRPIHIETGLTNKRGRHDEEDQHDEDHVEHRGEIDLILFVRSLQIR